MSQKQVQQDGEGMQGKKDHGKEVYDLDASEENKKSSYRGNTSSKTQTDPSVREKRKYPKIAKGKRTKRKYHKESVFFSITKDDIEMFRERFKETKIYISNKGEERNLQMCGSITRHIVWL